MRCSGEWREGKLHLRLTCEGLAIKYVTYDIRFKDTSLSRLSRTFQDSTLAAGVDEAGEEDVADEDGVEAASAEEQPPQATMRQTGAPSKFIWFLSLASTARALAARAPRRE